MVLMVGRQWGMQALPEKTSSLAALGSWTPLSLDTSSALDRPSGGLRVRVSFWPGP